MNTNWRKTKLFVTGSVSSIAVIKRLAKKNAGSRIRHLLVLSTLSINVLKLFLAALMFKILNLRKTTAIKNTGRITATIKQR